MMKRILSLIMTAIMCGCILMMFTGCSVSVTPNNYKGWNGIWQDSCLLDDRNLFSDTQRQELDEMIQEKSRELEMNILIYVNGTYRSDYDTKEFCDYTYESIFAPDTDGLMYYLDLSSKTPAYDYISTSGKAILFYEGNRNNIFNHMDLYLPSSGSSYESDQIYRAVEEFLNQLSVYANNRSTSYYHDESKGTYIYYKGDKLYVTTKKPLILLLPIWFASAIIGLVTALITFLISKGHYKFKPKTNPSVYLSRDSVNFTQRSDSHIRTYQSRTRISSSSGGGGGGSHRSGGGGGHHSSGSHGGGGHHR